MRQAAFFPVLIRCVCRLAHAKPPFARARLPPDSELGELQPYAPIPPARCVGARAFIVGVVDHSYLITLLHLWLAMPSYPPTMLAVLAMRRAFAGGGSRPYLCQVGCTTTGAPRIFGRLPASGRPRRRANCPRV
ncbi:hypothetical protein B296_00052667 [Ensete ventricosum]|uniref:Secreted protein n=1 Tax=Ensete ventricosum TaxID=4639 RepID=A0A426XF58_ENSVE|nr:hypothetical protein B296_00052667 [Ensete ventricosum]